MLNPVVRGGRGWGGERKKKERRNKESMYSSPDSHL